MARHRLLLAPLALVFLALVACQGGESPTEIAMPSVEKAAAAAAVADADVEGVSAEERPLAGRLAARDAADDGSPADASPAEASPGPEEATALAKPGRGNGGGNGNGNGNGNGGNGNGNGNGGNGGGHGNRGGDLRLELQPDVWNTNYEHSAGTVSALVRGADVAKIDTASVRLVCEGGTELAPTRVQTGGGQLRAFFFKSDAIGCLDDPDPGEVHEVILKLTVDGTAKELTAHVRIVGPRNNDDDDDDDGDEEGEVDLDIQPDTWNTNWRHAQGTVSALIRGEDVGDVSLDGIVLVGSSGTEVQPVSVKRTGHQIRARFPMAEAFNSLDDPDPGEIHEVKVKLMVGGTAKELTDTVRIVGPAI